MVGRITMSVGAQPARAVAIVTGGSVRAGCDVAHALASWAWPTVVVYLDDQSRAETTVAEIIAAGGTTVAVRADLADDLDVGRIFDESIAAFGGVDVVIHATTEAAPLLFAHAAQHVSRGGVIVVTSSDESVAPAVASLLREREVAVEQVPQEGVLDFLERWRSA